ncbi:MAG: hypothetical protein M5U28_14520 [Sandaracinaceae bacterium]|nr:hypothetical protein [Sandaracinaceae bacterium]
MTQHDDIRELLLDRDEGGPLAPEVQAHLEECEDCRAFADALSGVDARLAALPPLEASEALLARTMERIEREEATAPAPGFLAILLGVGAALLGGLWAFAKLLALPFTSRRARRWTLGGLRDRRARRGRGAARRDLGARSRAGRAGSLGLARARRAGGDRATGRLPDDGGDRRG